MNIAHLLPYRAKFPLSKHNGRYEWALRLATLQAKQGHHVTIYCAPDSDSPTPELHWKSLAADLGDRVSNNKALIRLALQDPQHDIYHSHLDYLHYFEANSTQKPIVFTQHWFPNQQVTTAAATNTTHNVIAVPLTRYMRQEDIKLHIPCAEVIYHGIDLSTFTLSSVARQDRLLFLGRITPQKGVREAVAMARLAGEKLDIVGKINSKDAAYWESILPLVDGQQIRYLGPRNRSEVVGLLSQAKALVFLPQAIEAFGQIIIEAQACGTAVIVNSSGAAKELVENGKTGFVVKDEGEFLSAIQHIGSIDALACRTFAERFDQQHMTNAYEQLYRQLISHKREAS